MLPYKVLRYKVNKAWHSCACRTYIQKIWISKLSCNKAKHPGNMLSISYSCIFLLNLERFNLPYFICFSEQPWAIKWNSENHSVSKYWSWISKKQNKAVLLPPDHNLSQDPVVQLNTTKYTVDIHMHLMNQGIFLLIDFNMELTVTVEI